MTLEDHEKLKAFGVIVRAIDKEMRHLMEEDGYCQTCSCLSYFVRANENLIKRVINENS